MGPSCSEAPMCKNGVCSQVKKPELVEVDHHEGEQADARERQVHLSRVQGVVDADVPGPLPSARVYLCYKASGGLSGLCGVLYAG